jgi:hypothetical protein
MMFWLSLANQDKIIVHEFPDFQLTYPLLPVFGYNSKEALITVLSGLFLHPPAFIDNGFGKNTLWKPIKENKKILIDTLKSHSQSEWLFF